MRRSIFYILTIVFLLIPLILIGIACWDDRIEMEILPPPRPHPPTIQLTAEDVGVTDVMLKISIAQDRYPRTVTLKRDTLTVLTTTLTSPDTMIVDEGLQPKHTYKYTLMRPLERRREEIKDITVTTMDTTSHNFIWEIDTLGDGNSSVLRDVAIINDTLAYAVGEIYEKDSTGKFETEHYGLARWNGKEWALQRLKVLTPAGFYSVLGPDGIFAFSSNDIWLANGDVHHYNGSTVDHSYWLSDWIGNPDPLLPPGQSVQKIWGTSRSNLYAVGRGGAIVHFDGSTWQEMESGTDLDIYDIFGKRNDRTGEIEIYAVAAKQFVTFDKKIFKINGTKVISISTEGISYNLHGIWFKPGVQYYVVGSGMYHKRDPMQPGLWTGIPASVTQYGIYEIKGNNINDIFACGAFGELLHYNGMSWKSYVNVTAISLGAYYGLSFKDNLIMAVGQESPKGIIAIGRQ